MTTEDEFDAGSNVGEDRAVGTESAAEERTLGQEFRSYALGLALAVALTAASFWVRGTDLVYGRASRWRCWCSPSPNGHSSHLLPAYHDRSGQHQQCLALAFGVLIVCLIVFGSLWVMQHLNHNMVRQTN